MKREIGVFPHAELPFASTGVLSSETVQDWDKLLLKQSLKACPKANINGHIFIIIYSF